MKKYISALFLVLVILRNSYSMEQNSNKRNHHEIEKEKEQPRPGNKTKRLRTNKHYSEILVTIDNAAESLKSLPIQTTDIIDEVHSRINTLKAYSILSQVPIEICSYILNIFFEQQICFLIDKILSSKQNQYTSNNFDASTSFHMPALLDELLKEIEAYFNKFFVNIMITIKLMNKLENNCNANDSYFTYNKLIDFKNFEYNISDKRLKQTAGLAFKKIILKKFNVLNNQNLQNHFERIFACRDFEKLVQKWHFMLNHLIENPKLIRQSLKILCGHWLAKSNQVEKLYKLIQTHNCPSSECNCNYILLQNHLVGVCRKDPVFKQGTLLMTALFFKAFDVARWLIQNKIQLEFEDSAGNTALIYCINGLADTSPVEPPTAQDIMNYQEMVKLLLNAGCTKKVYAAYTLLHSLRLPMLMTHIKVNPTTFKTIFYGNPSVGDERMKAFDQAKSNISLWLVILISNLRAAQKNCIVKV